MCNKKLYDFLQHEYILTFALVVSKCCSHVESHKFKSCLNYYFIVILGCGMDNLVILYTYKITCS